MIKPISPEEASGARKIFPDQVIKAFNELIVENLRGNVAKVLQKDVVGRISDRMMLSKEVIYANGWLDVEELYKQHGWIVEYDKPAYCESYDAVFYFKTK